ncbi:hypothetical protein E5161_00015 [Cohnella pontilimi]|uniref:Uncharacterized protein n=1 Tax=Cohnella pontilimi TaxID=2564100 RepID=A0A4U0FG02_9BACL|nr:hypothetical protein [Cohnella pontilimi]TJY43837.1 hypothetical protein E5161_00015 [Cohnella pontilimi]
MINELLKTLDETPLEDDVFFRITECVKRTDDELELSLDIVYQYQTDVIQTWKLTCKDVHDHKISFCYFESIEEYDEHILLWRYNQPDFELYFSSIPNDIEALIGKLYREHIDITKQWIPFGSLFNEKVNWLLEQGNGLLATGPEQIINVYNRALQEQGVRSSIIAKGQQQTNNYKVLLLEDSFIIAKEFEAQMIK